MNPERSADAARRLSDALVDTREDSAAEREALRARRRAEQREAIAAAAVHRELMRNAATARIGAICPRCKRPTGHVRRRRRRRASWRCDTCRHTWRTYGETQAETQGEGETQ